MGKRSEQTFHQIGIRKKCCNTQGNTNSNHNVIPLQHLSEWIKQKQNQNKPDNTKCW